MTNKDKMLLEEAYSQIIKERWENVNTPNYICVNQDDGEYHTFSDFDEAKNACDQFNSDDNTKVWVVKYDGDVVYPKESEVGTPAYDDGPIPILRNLGDTSKERINKARENGEDILKIIAQLEKESGSVPARLARALQHRRVISDEEYNNYLNSINPSNTTSDMTYAKKGGYVESFVHGIQPIVEAKKKVNPWAIEKSIEKKTGKKFGKKHKEEIVKGIKKSAKKSGKKITSDKVEPKKK